MASRAQTMLAIIEKKHAKNKNKKERKGRSQSFRTSLEEIRE